MREALRFAGSVREVTVSREAGRWYVAFSVEDGVDMPAQKMGPIIGVDVGVKTLATATEAVFLDKDTGKVKEKCDNPKPLKRYLRKLRRLNKQLSRQCKGMQSAIQDKAALGKDASSLS